MTSFQAYSYLNVLFLILDSFKLDLIGFFLIKFTRNLMKIIITTTQNLMFSLAGYKTFNLRPSKKIGNRQFYTYSQAGLKVDYFNGMLIPQLSALFTQTSGIDIGYAFNFSNPQIPDVNFYSINIAAYYPINQVSIGLNARILSDFSDHHFLHYGITAKYNLKLGKKVTNEALKKIKADIQNVNVSPLK